MKMKLLADYHDQDEFSGQLLVANVAKCVNNDKRAYLNIELRDSSCSMNAKKWDATEEDERIIVAGNVINISSGVINLYKNSLQMKILSCESVSDDEIDVTKFLKEAPVAFEILDKEFRDYYRSIKDETLRKILDYVFKKYGDKFLTYPAGASVHHDYYHGLLYHTLSMLHHAEHFISYYGDIDKDLLYSAIILHDVGKTIELEGSVVYSYTQKGKLIGHISLMSAEIQEAKNVLGIDNEKTTLLQHMILSHHGQLEFGSPVLPQTKEALLLSLIDNLDSKMAIASKALEVTKEGEYSSKIYALDGRCLYKPKND